MGPLEKTTRRGLDHVERLTCFVMAVAMVVLVLGVNFQVIARCFLSYSAGWTQDMVQLLSWSQELVQYAFVWMVFLGVGVGTRRSLHLRINLLEGALSPGGRRLLGRAIDAACLVFAVLFVVAGAMVACRVCLHSSPAMCLSMGLVYCVFPLSGLGLIAFLLEAIVWGRPAGDAETPGGDA